MSRSSLFNWIVLLVLVGAAIAVVTVKRETFRSFFMLDSEEAADEDLQIGLGAKLVAMKLPPLVGKAEPVTLEDLPSRVTLVNFWGTWCPPCIEEFPHLAELAKSLSGEKRFQMISVSCSPGPDSDGEGLREATTAFLEENDFHLPVYWDPDAFTRQAVIQSTQADFAYPFTLLLDGEGRVARMWRGYMEGYTVEMEKAIRDALADL